MYEALHGLASANGVVTVAADGDDTLVTADSSGVTLRFDKGEWAAFIAGAERSEFAFAAVA